MSIDPVVSVVVVSDFDQGDTPWEHERVTLRELAAQDLDEPFEVLLVVPTRDKEAVPSELPLTRIVSADTTYSTELKDAATCEAAAPLIAEIDADCVPQRSWLRHLVEYMRAHPDADAVSGKSLHPGDGLIERCLGLYARALADPGGAGPTDNLSNHNAIFRRWVLERFPYPKAESPFDSAWTRMRSMRKLGVELHFEPEALVHHAFEGWRTELDIRRNLGFALVANRQSHRRGWIRLMRVLVSRTRRDWSMCLRLYRGYDLRAYELPIALALAPLLHALELRGIVDAKRGRSGVPGSAYY